MNASRKKTIAARKRAKRYPARYRRIAAYILDLRSQMDLTQAGLAKLLGVAEISVRRWELALGHEPAKATWKRLKELCNGNTIHSSKALQCVVRTRT